MRSCIGHVPCAGTALAIVALLAIAASAQAGPIDPSLTASGQITYAYPGGPSGGASVGDSGGMTVVQAGANTTTNWAAGAVTSGANPLLGSFTNIGDGFVISGLASTTNAGFATLLNFRMDLVNVSTGTFTVTILVDLLGTTGNTLGATGANAFTDSWFAVDLDGTRKFSSQYLSDTRYGDRIDGVLTGTYGQAFNDARSTTFDVTLAAGASALVSGFWTLSGEDFAVGNAYVDLDAAVTLDSFLWSGAGPGGPGGGTPPIPEPGTFALVAGGAMALVAMTRRRRKRT